MNYINLSDNQANSSIDNIGSIGTEHNVLNDNFNMIIKKMNQNGGNNNDNFDELMIEAAKDGNFYVVFYLIAKNKIKNIGITDNDGNNILHYFVTHFNKLNKNDASIFLAKLSSIPAISKLVNMQNKSDGNTPLHLAAAYDLDSVADEFVRNGADKSIVNKNNEYIAKESDADTIIKNDNRYMIPNKEINRNNFDYSKKSMNPDDTSSDIFIQKKDNRGSDSILDNIVKIFVGDKTSPESDASLRMTATDIKPRFPNAISATSPNNTTDIIGDVINKKVSAVGNDTSELINDIMGKKTSFINNTSDLVSETMKNSGLQRGGRMSNDVNSGTNYYDDTNRLRRQMGYGSGYVDDAKMQSRSTRDRKQPHIESESDGDGGAMKHKSKNRVKQSRTISDGKSDSDNNELSRLINNQATAIHERTVKKIMEILGIDENDAQIYKAALYESIKNDSPELNNYDRAVEMEKRANKGVLEKIDIDEWRKKIKENKEKRDSTKEKEKPKVKRQTRYDDSDDMTDTSILSVTSSDNSDSEL